jgi:hypothetical protein
MNIDIHNRGQNEIKEIYNRSIRTLLAKAGSSHVFKLVAQASSPVALSYPAMFMCRKLIGLCLLRSRTCLV